MLFPSVVTPGLKVQLFGAYCNNLGRSWNPDSGQPNVQDWKVGRDDFQSEIGAPFLNGGNIFCGSRNTSLKGNIAYSMSQVNQVYTNPPYDYIPSLGIKLFQVGELSPATGVAYVWNDGKAYADVAAGLWDASWTGVVDAMIAANRPIWINRVAYEGNASFMQDFSGFDSQPQQEQIWEAAMRRVFKVFRDYATIKGAYLLQGLNPTALSQGGPNVPGLFNAIGVDVQNVIMFDAYNGYWSLPSNVLPADVSGTVPGVGPTQTNLEISWNTQNGGFGWQQCSDMAIAAGMPIVIAETGSSGGSHHTLNDPYFPLWLAKAITAHRARGGQVICVNVWSVPAGDGNTGIQFGNQPATLAAYRLVVNTLIGDAFDPTAVPFGGKPVVITPPPLPPPTSHPTAISTVVVPSATIKSQPYAYIATASGGQWSSVGNVQYQQTIPANGNSSTGWVTPPAANVSLDPTGMIATISGLTSGITLPHTVQIRDKSFPSVVSPLVIYTTTAAPILHPLTITYSDGSPSKTVQVGVGVTAVASYVQPDWPPQPPMPPQTTTVVFDDRSIVPIISQNAPGTTIDIETETTLTYSDGSSVVVPNVPAATYTVDQQPQPPRVPQPLQISTVTFSDPSYPPIITLNAPGTVVSIA